MGSVLETKGLIKTFGMVKAADGIDVCFNDGEVIGIIGHNGSGKTTFVNLVTGYLRPDAGAVHYQGVNIVGLPPRKVTGLGVARSFQIPQLYQSMDVLENVLIAQAVHSRRGWQFWKPLQTSEDRDRAMALLEQFGLGDRAHSSAAHLAEGERKLLDIAMAMAVRPRVIFLDEPTSGVSIADKFDIMDRLAEALEGADVVTAFVEHDMDVIERYARRVLMFQEGRIAADGSPSDVLEVSAREAAKAGIAP